MAVVIFSLKDLSTLIPRKGRRIQNNAREESLLPSESLEPVKRIAFAKILWGNIDTIELQISLRPVNVGLGKIKGGCGSARKGGTNGKGSCIGKGIKHGVARLAAIPDSSSIVPLIKKDSLRIA